MIFKTKDKAYLLDFSSRGFIVESRDLKDEEDLGIENGETVLFKMF